MRISRRAFVLGTGVAAAVPLANLLSRAAIAGSELPLPEPSPSQAVAGVTGAQGVALRIEGWDLPDPIEPARDDVWISVGRSWRTTWR